MIGAWLDRAAAGVGRGPARLALAGCALGATTFAAAAAAGRLPIALASLAASWLCFAGAAAGAVALAAAVCVAGGQWAGPALPIAVAGAGFFRPALVLLALVAPGIAAVAPWHAAAGRAHQAWFVARVLVAAALVFVSGERFVGASRRAAPGGGRAAVVYLLAALAGLSGWCWELASGRTTGPVFTGQPAWYVAGCAASGLAWVALATAPRGAASADLRHDLGKLLFALVLIWAYLLWAIYLPTWYGALPEEGSLLEARWRGPWRVGAIATLAAAGAFPFCVLFPERGKRGRATLAAAAGAVLLGICVERHLVLLPPLVPAPGPAALAVAAGIACGVAGLFVLSVGARLAQARNVAGPPPPVSPPKAPAA